MTIAPMPSAAGPFVLRLEIVDDEDPLAPPMVRFLRDLPTMEAARLAYLRERDAAGPSPSRFAPGDIFDPAGGHVGRIGWTGELWTSTVLDFDARRIVRLPSAGLAWMAGPPEAVLRGAFDVGPSRDPDDVLRRMREGDVMIGRTPAGEIAAVRVLEAGALREAPGGLEDLRGTEAPSP